MKKTPLLVSVLVLAVLGGVLYWSNKSEEAKEKEVKPDETPKILGLDESSIQQIEIKSKDFDAATVLKKDASGKWSIIAPKPYAADQSAVEAIASATTNLRGDRVLDENAGDVSSFGLTPPLLAISFTDKAGKATRLLIGESTPTDQSVYAMVDGQKKLYTMASIHRNEFKKSEKDLRERHLLMAEQDKLSRLEFTSKGNTIEFGRAGESWQILKPQALRADGSQVEEVLRKSREAMLDPQSPDHAPEFKTAAPLATIRVTDPAGAKTLEIRKGKDECFAKSSTMEGEFKTNKDLCDGLDKTLDNFRNKKLFDFGFNDPAHVEFKDGAKSASYDKQKDGWMSAGKTMDSVGVQNLIDKLRDASASKLVASGYTTPSIEISVVSNDGKLKEKVQVTQAGDDFFARREGDATIYQVDKGVMEDIRRAGDSIQPAAQDKKESDKKESGKK
jgi:hypothetical protein